MGEEARLDLIIRKQSMVTPLEATPQRMLWNSSLDLVIPRIHTPSVYFYSNHDGSEDFFRHEKLAEALANVLVPFYPMAGRLKLDESGRIEINCNAEGVLLVEAQAKHAVVADFGEFAPDPRLRQLVPYVDYSQDISSFPLLVLQVTFFECGGVALGVGMQHIIADGMSGIHYINTWAAMAREIPLQVPPFIDRTLLKANSPPAPKFPHVEYQEPPKLLKREIANGHAANGSHVENGKTDGSIVAIGKSNNGLIAHGKSNGSHIVNGTSNGSHAENGKSNESHIANGTSLGRHAENGKSNGSRIANGTSNGSYAENGKSNGSHIANGTSNGSHAENGKSNGSHIANGTSNGSHAENGKSNGSHIANGTSNGSHAENGKSNGSHIANGTSNGSHVENGKSNGSHILNGTSNGSHAENGKSNGSHIANGTSNGSQVENGKMNGSHIANGKGNGSHVENGKSNGSHIANGKSNANHTANGIQSRGENGKSNGTGNGELLDVKSVFHNVNEEDIPMTVRVFKFTKKQLGGLKQKAIEASTDVTFSCYEMLSGHVWKCVTQARNLHPSQQTKLFIATDGRSRLDPPLPKGYFGNVIFTCTPIALAGDLVANPVTYAARRIHDALARMNNEYMRSALDYLEEQEDINKLVRGARHYNSPNLGITSWARMPVYECDFGWGRPIFMGPCAIAYEGLAFVLASAVNDGSLTLSLGLRADHMDTFAQLVTDF